MFIDLMFKPHPPPRDERQESIMFYRGSFVRPSVCQTLCNYRVKV